MQSIMFGNYEETLEGLVQDKTTKSCRTESMCSLTVIF